MEQTQNETTSIAVVSTQLSGLKELMIEKLGNQDKQLEAINKQTTATNGHVGDAFREIDKTNKSIEALNAAKNKLIGGLIVSQSVVLPVVLYLLYQRLK